MLRLERIGIGNFPTPLEEMPRLGQELGGPKLYVKRDDLTGLALGGNKVRKLDFLLVEARRRQADIIVTTCGIQSNWARQTVGAAIKLNMKTVLVLRTAQFSEEPKVYDGNLLLAHIMGADLSFVNMKIDEDPREILERVAQKLRNEGHNPYVLHLAAVESPITTVAYVEGMRELLEQTAGVDMDWMVVATGGGSTQAGLMLGARLLRARTKVIGVNVGAFSRETLIRTIQMSYGGAAKLLGLGEQRVAPEDIVIFDDYIGQGYGVPTEGSLDALRLVARTESLILDPVYTSKAMAGLLDLVKRGYFGKEDNVCFLHTGGVPALFAYKEYFSPTSSSTDYSARKPKTHMCPGVDR